MSVIVIAFILMSFSCAKSDCPLESPAGSVNSEPSTCFLATFVVLRSPWAILSMALDSSILGECEHDLSPI